MHPNYFWLNLFDSFVGSFVARKISGLGHWSRWWCWNKHNSMLCWCMSDVFFFFFNFFFQWCCPIYVHFEKVILYQFVRGKNIWKKDHTTLFYFLFFLINMTWFRLFYKLSLLLSMKQDNFFRQFYFKVKFYHSQILR